MIPFASQRGGGRDLAAHLMNAFDNEHVEVAEMRGAIARDLLGAFAEWEAQAAALTRCRQYLCSLSINPDELQGRLTRAQYFDYIERAEAKLGLKGQPRAVIFHIKKDDSGRAREHCHVVWSRVDARAGKAVQLSFFKEKLMTVTREFARVHGLELPDGYRRHEEKVRRRNRQLSGYDCIKQKETGITHEERMAAVTAAWHRNDDGPSFVSALEDLGYVLCRGRDEKRLVLVDFYGHMSALARLIDDPAVKSKHVRERLGPDYVPENLPTAEEAQTFAAQRRKAIEEFERARQQSEDVTGLIKQQQARRKILENEFAILRGRQRKESTRFALEQLAARQALRSAYLAECRLIRVERSRRRPRGLAAFLGRVTGIALITRKVQRYRDRQHFRAYRAQCDELLSKQREETNTFVRRHELQAAEIERKLRALDQVEKRERASLEQTRRKERRRRINARHEHMPPLGITLHRPDGSAGSGTADSSSPIRSDLDEAALEQRRRQLIDEFSRAAAGEEGDGDGAGEASGAPHPAAEPMILREWRRDQLSRLFNIAADPDPPIGGAGGVSEKPRHDSGPDDDGPTWEPDPDAPRPRPTPAPGRKR